MPDNLCASRVAFDLLDAKSRAVKALLRVHPPYQLLPSSWLPSVTLTHTLNIECSMWHGVKGRPLI